MKYKVLKQKLKSTKGEFFVYRFLSNKCKCVYNKAIENIKNHYLEKGTYINKYDNYNELANIEESFWLNQEIFQKTIFRASAAYESYFKLLNYQKKNNLKITARPPKFISGFYPIMFSYIGKKYENGKRIFNIPLSVPYKKISRELKEDLEFFKQFTKLENYGLPDDYFIKLSMPRYLTNKKIKEISIIPLYGGKKFEIAYTYLDCEEKEDLKDNEDVLSIDLGINNLATCITTKGDSFIIDGKRLKSMNQFYNKRIAKLRKDNQFCLRKKLNPLTDRYEYKLDLKKNLKEKEKYKSILTKRMIHIMEKRENKINDYIYKSTNMIINYCKEHSITKIVLGYSNEFQSKAFEYSKEYKEKNNYLKHIEKNMIKENNQKFLNIPFGKIKNRLEYLSNKNGIELIIQEESYTSASSFFDLDPIPVYSKENELKYQFSGERIERGLYKTKDNKYINADVNGALNIYRKSSVCDMNKILYLLRRGVSTPRRLQVI